MKITKKKASLLGLAATTLLIVPGFTGCVYGPGPNYNNAPAEWEGEVEDPSEENTEEISVEQIENGAKEPDEDEAADPVGESADGADNVVEEADEDYSVYLEKADELRSNCEWEAAIEQYEKVFEITLKVKEAYLGIIESYVFLWDNASALDYLDMAKSNLDEADYSEIIDDLRRHNFHLLDTVHMAVLMGMMDPRGVNAPEYNDEYDKLSSGPQMVADMNPDNGPIEKYALETMGTDDGKIFVNGIVIEGEKNPQIMYQIIKSNMVKVWVEGYDDLVLQ